MELAGDGILLRGWRLEDADAIVAACQDPELSRWIPFIPSPYDRADAEAYLRACLEADTTRYPFAIADVETDEVLGSIDLRLNTHAYRGHVGYWVVATKRGRGICTTALRLVSRWGLDELVLQRLELITDPDNHASQRVAEKAGYQREGVLRAHLRHPDGRVRDSVLFSLIPGELLD